MMDIITGRHGHRSTPHRSSSSVVYHLRTAFDLPLRSRPILPIIILIIMEHEPTVDSTVASVIRVLFVK